MKRIKISTLLLALAFLLSSCSSSSNNSLSSKDTNYEILEDETIKIVHWDQKAEEISIPEKIGGRTVTAIGNEALGYNPVKKISLPESINLIEGNPFSSCHDLEVINVSNNHKYLATIDGVLFSKPDKRLIHYPRPLPAKIYSVPEGIKIIGQKAFAASHNLTIVKLPNSLETIEQQAFNSCRNLVGLDLPAGLRYIGDEAFGSQEYGSSFVIPARVEYIGNNPFSFSRDLKQIKVAKENKKYESIDGVLFDKETHKLISYPQAKADYSYNVPVGTEIIGSNAFISADNLHFIKLSDGLKSIEDSAFMGCGNLSSINLPESLENIEENAFWSSEALTNIVIPERVKVVGDGAFMSCYALKEVTIKDGVKSISDSAFLGCSSLQRITIPQSITKIGKGAFLHCPEDMVVSITNNEYAIQYCKDNNLKYMVSSSTNWLTSDEQVVSENEGNPIEKTQNPYQTIGEIVTFGTYPQTASGTDKTAIEWNVLDYDAENNKVLLLSHYGLEAKPLQISGRIR